MIVGVCIVVSIPMFLYKLLTEKFVIYFFWALSKHDWKKFNLFRGYPYIKISCYYNYVNIIKLNELNTTNKTA